MDCVEENQLSFWYWKRLRRNWWHPEPSNYKHLRTLQKLLNLTNIYKCVVSTTSSASKQPGGRPFREKKTVPPGRRRCKKWWRLRTSGSFTWSSMWCAPVERKESEKINRGPFLKENSHQDHRVLTGHVWSKKSVLRYLFFLNNGIIYPNSWNPSSQVQSPLVSLCLFLKPDRWAVPKWHRTRTKMTIVSERSKHKQPTTKTEQEVVSTSDFKYTYITIITITIIINNNSNK